MTRLQKYSPEWIAETEEVRVLLDTWLHNPEDPEIRSAVLDSLEKLGLIVTDSSAYPDFDASNLPVN